MKKNIATIAMLSLAAAAATSCGSEKRFDAAGYFEATEITVSSEATGRILAFDISDGDKITAGETVGAIDSTQLYLNRLLLDKKAESVVSNRPDIPIQTSVLDAQLKTLRAEKARVEKLVKAKAVPTKQLDDINASISQLESQMDAQKSTLQNSAKSIDAQSSAIDIQIALIDDQIAKCRLSAPVGGTVLATYAEVGEFAVAGRPLYKIADLDNMTLRAYVSSAQLARLAIGREVEVEAQFGDNNNRAYKGVVTTISSESEFTPKNIPTDKERADMVYAIKIRVKNDGYIKIGTYAVVRL